MKEKNITLILSLVKAGEYFLNGIRLAFDAPYEVYIVNDDLYMPYYRVYINGELAGMALYERQADEILLNLTEKQAHIFSIGGKEQNR